ncbi:gtpase activating protein [Nesidiocoris tenuis]|uniref:Gtpase activating protein n=1 Tax=Nesidiocoris tenuis TaxID=355587 RepID=A0ABN7AS83_9HEMI|nr:gtpase activating protein [Nesidiocoris tenuis]
MATVDHILSAPMIPWVMAQIRLAENSQKVAVRIENGTIDIRKEEGNVSLASHYIHQVSRLTVQTTSIFYCVKDHSQPSNLLVCYLFQSAEPHTILDMMVSMKEQSSKMTTRSGSSLCPDISPSSSLFFEVLYIGRIKVSHKKVPETFTDDALEKFKSLEKAKKEKDNENAVLSKMPNEELDASAKNGITYGSSEMLKNTTPDPPPPEVRTRRRSGSLGSVLIPKPETHSKTNEGLMTPGLNRTMVLHVGKSDLRLVSPDRKQILLYKYLKDINATVQGVKNPSHFAFICREANADPPAYIGYVFNCQSKDVADNLIAAIGQASATNKKTSLVVSCEHCPMVWYHNLCTELEGLSEKAMEVQLSKYLESLPSQELAIVKMKLGGAEIPEGNASEHIQLVMMLLRAHCESKQARHVHDTPENRHEFLTHYLGSGTIFMKAKRSLTSSFDQLLKRRNSKDDFYQSQSLPPNATLKDIMNEPKSISNSESLESTIISEEPTTPGGSMMNIFKKLGSTSKTTFDDPILGDPTHSKRKETTWRQAIFNNVVTPSKVLQDKAPEKKDSEFYKTLWKKAINQQILLIRMEKENRKLSVHQEEANVKRVKLEYEEIGSVECADVWEATLKESRKLDNSLILNTMKSGVPKAKRGDVWLFLARQYSSKLPPFNDTNFPNYNVSYEQILKQLTSHHHAILIDLGRTFPNHKYYSSPLGPGQLALFNILKAYSLLDPEVGYCQGLSFLAAVLLLHMSEGDAFYMLKHLMFCRGLRARYLPDMGALQVSLYQLSRLLHDRLPDLYAHFDTLDVPPVLYAAPWILTFFASQFSLGFVSRVLDLVFADSPNVLHKMAIVLLRHNKEKILSCETFEEVTNFLKHDLPHVDTPTMDKLVKEVMNCDITKELTEYGVEYHVLQEEILAPRPETKRIKELEAQNELLNQQVTALNQQLQIATSNINRLEASRSSHITQLNRLEAQVKSLEVTVSTLGQYVSDLGYTHKDVQIPNDVLRILAQINVSQKKKLRPQMSTPELRVGDVTVCDGKPAFGNGKLVRKLSDDPKLSETLDLIQEENEQNVRPSIGRILSEDEKAKIAARSASLNRNKEKETSPKLKVTQSSFELGLHCHPLDVEEVPTKFEGTTNLKRIQLTRNQRAETNKNIELKIVESARDTVGDKLKMTKNKVTRLFESCNDIFKGDGKPFGQETQLLIKSQVIPNARNSFS